MEPITVAAVVYGAVKTATPIIKEGLEMLNAIATEPLKVKGAIMVDRLNAQRYIQAVEVAAEVRARIDRAGIAPRQLPPSFIRKFIEGAGDAVDGKIKSMWAKLMAAAVADDIAQHPALSSALSRMTSDDARIIEWIDANGPLPAIGVQSMASIAHWADAAAINLAIPNRIPFYLANIDGLGLVHSGGPVIELPPEDYLRPEVLRLKAQMCGPGEAVTFPTSFELSTVGRLLAETCIRERD